MVGIGKKAKSKSMLYWRRMSRWYVEIKHPKKSISHRICVENHKGARTQKNYDTSWGSYAKAVLLNVSITVNPAAVFGD